MNSPSLSYTEPILTTGLPAESGEAEGIANGLTDTKGVAIMLKNFKPFTSLITVSLKACQDSDTMLLVFALGLQD